MKIALEVISQGQM